MFNDLVYITEGEFKGRITLVSRYMPEYDAVTTVAAAEKRIVPKLMLPDGLHTHLLDYPLQIPRKNVKVVGKEVSEDGTVKHYVADEIEFGDEYYDSRHKKWLKRRHVKYHPEIVIPWPNPSSREDGEYLTSEAVVLNKSYELRSIAEPPIPQEALRQLRNPYLSYKKRVLLQSQAYRLNAPSMPLTIEQKIYLARKAQKPPAKPLQPLLEEVKNYIGERMASHLNGISNPSMLAHLDALSKQKLASFAQTMEKIKVDNSRVQNPPPSPPSA